MGIGGMLEVFGGGLLLVGLFTRPVAFLLSGEMAVAYFQFHAAERHLAARQPGAAGGPFLLYLVVLIGRRGRAVEPGRAPEKIADGLSI